MLFEGQAAIVTGGTRGIGKAITLMLAGEGADVAFTYLRSVKEADELVKEIEGLGRKALALQIDVRDFQKSKELVEKVKLTFGRLDILVNNAGVTKDKALMLMAKEDWQEVIDTNLSGTFNMTRNAIVTFLKQKKGNIVNITSVSGIAGMSRQVNYAASKAGIIGFTKSLAKEVAGLGVRVNAVAPGFVDTDMVSGLKEEYKNQLTAMIPLARFGKVSDVSGVVKFLLSDAASYITGQTIVVDGGLFIQ